ncbi:DUF190 domain-containing protein [Pseudomonadota bacterium]
MNLKTVTVVRIYLSEAKRELQSLLAKLHDEEKVAGLTVFRGISGFGRTGKIHSSNLLDLSMDLPIVIEFFDEPEKVENILEHLGKQIDPGHLLIWSAEMNG